MSLSICLKIGTGIGSGLGLISSAYFAGAAERADRNDRPGAFAGEMFSVASIISGPFVGAAGGLSFYGFKRSIHYLRTAPRSTKLTLLTIASAAIAIKGASTLGKADK